MKRSRSETKSSANGFRRVRSALEAGLWLFTLAIASMVLVHVVEAKTAAHAASVFGAQQTTGRRIPAQGEASNPLPPGTEVVHGDGAVIGRLEIPQVALSVPVLENYDPDTLRHGVGHIPGTALPGGLGNLGLAGHRDTFLRPLRNVRRGMEIDLVTADGKYRYQTDSFEIVTPEEVQVLDIHNRPEMTLVTCYPFNFVGAAPKRFIVHAHLLSLEPS